MAQYYYTPSQQAQAEKLQSQIDALNNNIKRLEGFGQTGHFTYQNDSNQRNALQAQLSALQQEASKPPPGVVPATGPRGSIESVTGIGPRGPKDVLEQSQMNINMAQDLAKMYAANRETALAKGRIRGQEVFGEGSLGRVGSDRAQETSDIISQRQALMAPQASEQQMLGIRQQNLQGMTPNELAALRSTNAQLQNRQFQGQSRALAQQLGQTGLRGGQRAVQLRKLGEAQSGVQAQGEREMYLQNLNMQRQAQDQLEATAGQQLARKTQALSGLESSTQAAQASELARKQYDLQRAAQEKAGQITTEMGYGGLAAGDVAAGGAQLQNIQSGNQLQAFLNALLAMNQR